MGLDKKKLKKLNISAPTEDEDEDEELVETDEDEDAEEDTEQDDTEDEDEELEVPVPSNLQTRKHNVVLKAKKQPKVELIHEDSEAEQRQLVAQEVTSLHDNGIFRFRLIGTLNLIATKLDNIEKKLDNLTSKED